MPKLYNVEAEYHMDLYSRKTGEFFGYRVKVSILDDALGFYINGMVVSPPECNKEKTWMVFTPKQGNARIIEFNGKNSKLWPEIKQVCLDVVWEHIRQQKMGNNEDPLLNEELSTEEFNKQMMKDLDNLGF